MATSSSSSAATKRGYVRPFRESSSTYEGGNTALKIFDFSQKKRNQPEFAKLTEKVVEADNLQQLIGRFAIWLAQFPIPTWSDENFEPRASAGDKAISYFVPETKKKYRTLCCCVKIQVSTAPRLEGREFVVTWSQREFCKRKQRV